MKLVGGQIERFLRRPDRSTVLVYGPDQGLVRERVLRLIATAVDDPSDPFRVSELGADLVRSDPGRLLDEARSLCLLGGRRVVRLRQAGDLATAGCRALLQIEPLEALVVIDAGELAASSSLRRLIEGARNAAALPCYRDEGRDLGELVERLLAEHGLTAEAEARAWLVEHLGADRGITRSEIEKLALYWEPAAGEPVTLAAAATMVGDSAALDLDDLVHAAAAGDAPQLERCLDRLLGEGHHQLCARAIGRSRLRRAPGSRPCPQEGRHRSGCRIVKAASDVYAPVDGEITAANAALSSEPALVNSSAAGDGWLWKMKLADESQLVGLLDEAGYKALVG